MIKVDCYDVKARDFKIHVETSINEDLKDLAEEVLTFELVAIFKQLHTIDPEILLDALEVYQEVLKND